MSEELSPPFDEGRKNFARNLIRELHDDGAALALSIRGGKTNDRYIKRLDVNKTFLSYSLFREIRNFNPAVVIYVPSPSATVASFMRTKVLSLYVAEAKIVMIALQPVEYSILSRKIIPLLAPDLVLVQSPSVVEQLSTCGCYVELIPSGVDLEKFCPATGERKLALRKKYEVDPGKFAIVHVGHINRNRNIQILKGLQKHNNQILVVGSTSTQQDENLMDELRRGGVRVIASCLENVEELYHLSDCYVFPVTSQTASIEMPLSVLEAMACNLPIITTRYGGLPTMFNNEGNGFFFVDEFKDLSTMVERAKKLNHCETRKMVECHSWREVTNTILESLRK